MIILVDLFRKMVKVTDGADESSLEQVCKAVHFFTEILFRLNNVQFMSYSTLDEVLK